MTTVDAGNIHALAVEGTFDDCQAIVKALFQHPRFADEVRLSGVNSINWARVAAQAVYYFTSAVALGSPHRPVSFSVPTGNFGDILAGWAAKRMGLPVGRLMIATNANDILARTLATGSYEVRGVAPTTSPSMDIQVSSNFERLLFECARPRRGLREPADGRPEAIRRLHPRRADPGAHPAEFDAAAVPEDEVVAEIRDVYEGTGQIIDPHSAIGVRAARKALAEDPATPVVALATAHAAKFPDAVEAATGVRPALPPHLADLLERRERFTVLPNDEAAVERAIRERARILRSAA